MQRRHPLVFLGANTSRGSCRSRRYLAAYLSWSYESATALDLARGLGYEPMPAAVRAQARDSVRRLLRCGPSSRKNTSCSVRRALLTLLV